MQHNPPAGQLTYKNDMTGSAYGPFRLLASWGFTREGSAAKCHSIMPEQEACSAGYVDGVGYLGSLYGVREGPALWSSLCLGGSRVCRITQSVSQRLLMLHSCARGPATY